MGISLGITWSCNVAFRTTCRLLDDRPEAVKIDNKKLAADGLAKLGPMKISEKIWQLYLFLLLSVGHCLPLVLI